METADILSIISISIYSILWKFKTKTLKNKTYFNNITIDDIQNLKGREFEEFCNWALQKNGYDTTLLNETNDYGRDIIIHGNNEDIYVECKRYTSNATKTERFMIGREICEKLAGAMISNGVSKGIIMTTGNIHRNATEYINRLKKNSDLDIQIWDMYKIENLLKNI
ncbi:hypothetical protein K144316041_p20010 (plasmid) [Clostridium tetani]|uniref:restriction endonuclease n=1 Tax=Clostridium tetani TaxID=1513 RepID=UPI002955DA0D|nr:restriction endonuclease [Clostridium tetani]BDR74162.1 hypothetical protein K144316041_p20010 [Clostridium tetani]